MKSIVMSVLLFTMLTAPFFGYEQSFPDDSRIKEAVVVECDEYIVAAVIAEPVFSAREKACLKRKIAQTVAKYKVGKTVLVSFDADVFYSLKSAKAAKDYDKVRSVALLVKKRNERAAGNAVAHIIFR